MRPEAAERVRAFLSLGSNLGDRLGNLVIGVQGVAALPESSVEATSSLYETEPVGRKEQPPFLNAVVAVVTGLSPHDLLGALQAIEKRAGRQRLQPWGPRTLDIDIVLYGDLVYADAVLSIPHPHFATRRFVLVPLAELAPSLVPPGNDRRTVRQLLRLCPDKSAVRRIDKALMSSTAIPWGGL